MRDEVGKVRKVEKVGRGMSRLHLVKVTINVAILIIWGVLMFFLLGKEGLLTTKPDRILFSELIPESMEVDSWKGIYVDDRWIGYNHTLFGPSIRGYRVVSSSYLRFKMLNEIKDITIVGTQELDRDHRLSGFEVRISGIAGIEIKGRRVGNLLITEVSYGTTSFQHTFDAADDLLLDQSLLQVYRGRDLKIHDSYSLRILNPLSLKAEDVTVRVTGKEQNLTVMETRFAGLSSRSWIDENGMVVREETPNGWVIKAESEASIKEHLARSRREAVDILRQVSVVSGRTITDPRSVTYMKIRITGYDLADIPSDGTRQHIIDSTEGLVTITAEPFDMTALTAPLQRNDEYRNYLNPSPWIDSADPEIAARSKAIVGDETHPWKAALRINEWIYVNLEKKFTSDLPIATSVLQTMRGDCNEHTSLFVALARAAGIPAKMIGGLAWVNDAFYYHAWPAVFVGTWVHLDPVFGQSVADATHIELVSGDFSSQAKIALAMGKIRIDVLEYR